MYYHRTSLHPDVCIPDRNVYIGAPRDLYENAAEASFIIENGKSWEQPKWYQQQNVSIKYGVSIYVVENSAATRTAQRGCIS